MSTHHAVPASALRGRQGDADRLHPRPGEAGHERGRRVGQLQPGEAAGGVEGDERRRGDGVALDGRPSLVGADGHRQDHDVGELAAEHRARAAGEPQPAVAAGGAVDCAAQGDGADPLTGGQVVAGPDDGRRPHRREDRAGGHDPTQLLEDHGQLGVAVALTAVGLGHGEPEPPDVCQRAPERRERVGVGVGVHGGAGHRGRAPVGGEATSGGEEGQVVLTDGDAHVPPLVPHASNDHVTLAGEGSRPPGRRRTASGATQH